MMMQRGGFILGTGGFGAVHTMNDIMDAPEYDRAEDAVVRAVVVSPGLAPFIIHKPVKVRSLVHELGALAVYKQAAPASPTSPAKQPLLNEDANVLLRVAMLSAMAEANGSCRKAGGIAGLIAVVPYVVVVPGAMPDLATALVAGRVNSTVLLISMRLVRGSRVHSELAIMRRMEGSMDDLEDVKAPMTVRDLLGAARAVLNSLNILTCTGGSHQDVKPGNILFQRSEGRWKFVLADFGLVSWETHQVKFHGTPGFISPLLYVSRTEYLQHVMAHVSQSGIMGLGGKDIWDSFTTEMRLRARASDAVQGAMRDGEADTYGSDMALTMSAMVQRTYQKNDLYALGMICLRYVPQTRGTGRARTNRAQKRSAQDALQGYAVRLILGGAGGLNQRDNGIWTVSAALVELTRLELAISRTAAGKSALDLKVTKRRAHE